MHPTHICPSVHPCIIHLSIHPPVSHVVRHSARCCSHSSDADAAFPYPGMEPTAARDVSIKKKKRRTKYIYICMYMYTYAAVCAACRILVPQRGTELGPSSVKAPSPNHWTAREFSVLFVRRSYVCLQSLGLLLSLNVNFSVLTIDTQEHLYS